VEITLELLRELTKDDRKMWVIGGSKVSSENSGKGIKEPEVSGKYVTIEADNWHFHLVLDDVTGIQFVEAESHGDMHSYYVRFSGPEYEDTLVRSYFPNPNLGDDEKRTEFQPEKLKAFEEFRDRYVGRDGIVFVNRPRQTS
jgi:putative heme iron utilization protein